MQESTKVFIDIGELLTLEGAATKSARSVQEQDLTIIRDAALVCENGKIAWCGKKSDLQKYDKTERVSLSGRTVLPAFVECHTHLIFAGNRAHEFEWRMQGQTYQEISAKGGGIRYTVNETRKASEQDLKELAQHRADVFVRQGVTVLEVKSGYGLDLNTELRSLKVARQLKGPKIVTTYLGAHSSSPDHKNLDDYLTMICEQVLPQAAQYADRVDIYIEKGFFTSQHAKRYFTRAQELGLQLTAHVEQLSDSGGTETALAFHPQSLDHLVYLNDATLTKLAKSETTGVLLPTSDFYLRMAYPPARKIIDSGGRVALSTDFNPGTSPTQDLSLVGLLARLEMKMTLPEVISAYTLGAAHALNLASEYGSLTVGKHCDFSVLDGSWRDLFYSAGHHPIVAVYRGGNIIHSAKI